MGHYCYFCGESKPNEAFSGKGHRQHLCRDCRSIPAAERKEWELFGRMHDLMDQSRISKKNVTWLKSLLEHSNESVRAHAQLLLALAEVAPYRKKRYQRIAQQSTKFYLRPAWVPHCCIRQSLTGGLRLDPPSPFGATA